jgi:hypothetical protein
MSEETTRFLPTVSRLAAGVLIAGLLAGTAAAQPSSPPSSTTAPPGPPPPASPTPPEKIAPPQAGVAAGGRTDSGVIHPPAGVDPGINTGVPATGAPATRVPEPAPHGMPVIPPPGTPGGNQRVQPK